MATISEIKEIIKAEVKERVKVDEIPDDGVLEDYGIDSLDKSSIFMEIEDKYEISIADTDLEDLKTLKDILLYINNK